MNGYMMPAATRYPASYHRALNHLVLHGGWDRCSTGRRLIGLALRVLRLKYPQQRAQFERGHMVSICGQWPEKPAQSAECRAVN